MKHLKASEILSIRRAFMVAEFEDFTHPLWESALRVQYQYEVAKNACDSYLSTGESWKKMSEAKAELSSVISLFVSEEQVRWLEKQWNHEQEVLRKGAVLTSVPKVSLDQARRYDSLREVEWLENRYDWFSTYQR